MEGDSWVFLGRVDLKSTAHGSKKSRTSFYISYCLLFQTTCGCILDIIVLETNFVDMIGIMKQFNPDSRRSFQILGF